jgi:transketolase
VLREQSAAVEIVCSHAGVEIGADGPSHIGLEDLAMMRAM